MRHLKFMEHDYYYNENGDLFILKGKELKPIKSYTYSGNETYILSFYKKAENGKDSIRKTRTIRKNKLIKMYNEEDILKKMSNIILNNNTLDDYYINEKSEIYSCITNCFIKHQKIGLYLGVSLHGKIEYVHRLIGETFLGDVDGLEINHKNLDKHDNNISNLEIVTRKENHEHWSKAYQASGGGRKNKSYDRKTAMAYYIDEYTFDGIFIKRYKNAEESYKKGSISKSTFFQSIDKEFKDITCKIDGVFYYYRGNGELLFETNKRKYMIEYVMSMPAAYSKAERPIFFRNRFRKGPKHSYKIER